MKKMSFIAVLLVCLTANIFAQAPDYIESSFHYKYPQISKERFEHLKVGYAITFKDYGERRKAYFDESGNWLRTETYMDGQYVPAAIKASISNSKYNGWDIEDARLIETPTSKIYTVGLDDKYDITGVGGYHYLYCTSSGNCNDK